jgi:hypothetical protein
MTKSDETEIELLKQEMKLVNEQNKIDHSAIMEAVKGLKEDLCSFKDNADRKYASREELVSLRKIVWFIVGAASGFGVWAIQEYLKVIAR